MPTQDRQGHRFGIKWNHVKNRFDPHRTLQPQTSICSFYINPIEPDPTHLLYTPLTRHDMSIQSLCPSSNIQHSAFTLVGPGPGPYHQTMATFASDFSNEVQHKHTHTTLRLHSPALCFVNIWYILPPNVKVSRSQTTPSILPSVCHPIASSLHQYSINAQSCGDTNTQTH